MIAHQPSDETRVVACQSLFETERFGIDCAKIGMIATTAFGDVVKERGEIGDLRARQRLHDAREIRQLVIEPWQGESSQVTHDE